MTELPLNLSPSAFADVMSVLREGCARGAFPGAAFGVIHRGVVVALEALGRFTFEPDSPSVTPETRFDLASVTKVVATTATAMLLWDRGRLDLDSAVGDLLPGFVIGAPEARMRARVTMRMLLAHSSGLPAHVPFYETCRSARGLLRGALQQPLRHEPGTYAEYSDVGFILLGKALEVIVGESLDRFCRRAIFAPLGMAHTRFGVPANERAGVPPTEEGSDGRVQGIVHDENCRVMGGVAGHAGLFAPALDVLRFAEALLAPLRPRNSLFTPDAVRLFTRRAELPPGSSRALGWDTPSGEPSSAGTLFSAESFGHLGYTGTSLWVDPDRDAAAVLLTNRTFPTGDNLQVRVVRPLFHDAVARALALLPGVSRGNQK